MFDVLVMNKALEDALAAMFSKINEEQAERLKETPLLWVAYREFLTMNNCEF